MNTHMLNGPRIKGENNLRSGIRRFKVKRIANASNQNYEWSIKTNERFIQTKYDYTVI